MREGVQMSKKVLVVDDEGELAELIEFELQARGFEAVNVTSGVGALKHLEKEKVDVVLTDVRMPGVDGVLLLKEIQKLSGSNKPTVILMTGFADIQESEAKQLGAVALLSKPIDYHYLEECIQNCG